MHNDPSASSKRRSRVRAFVTSSVGPLAVLLLVLTFLAVLLGGGCCLVKCAKAIQDSRVRTENRLNLA